MMGEELSDGCGKSRPVFGDITNQLGKRSLSSVLGSSGKRGAITEGVNLASKHVFGDDGQSVKRACLSPQRSGENNPLTKKSIFDSSKSLTENNNHDTSHLGKYDTTTKNSIESLSKGYVAVTSGTSVLGLECHALDKACEDIAVSSERTESETNECQNEADEHGAENLVISQSGSIDHSRFPDSQESRVEPDKCTRLQEGDGYSDPVTGIESIKSCSCTFCTKAAYIWLDLHYQDTKGRIAALKKSQKEASILAERSSKANAPQRHGSTHKTDSPNLESSLWNQWRSLFLHMENIYECESNQLESSLLSLTDLKDRCKAEMELINKTPRET
ncbi:unnamed protein product [Cuscuta campestris]|uniref:Uncharacterized protein n=2 Tax=Cuscuta sect. Cleistogrammica TaxID=1824901 RepID=A0A484KQ16_9ASTE|nr:hypothetical protein DM860_010688 [Cuscuta australis]VFQ67450.1 unnamed protein product [Cuscuta campestris]